MLTFVLRRLLLAVPVLLGVIFVVMLTLELIPAPRGDGSEQREVPVRAGHVVSRPAGTRIAHAFRAGPDGVTLLAYGTRDPNDVAYYPRSNKVYFRGVGLMARVQPLDYWDGEAEELLGEGEQEDAWTPTS